MNGHKHDARDCGAGPIIDRVNEVCASVGTDPAPGVATRIDGDVALRPLVVHTNLTLREADCLVTNIADGAMAVILRTGALEIETLRGLVGQAFLAGVFAGKDAS